MVSARARVQQCREISGHNIPLLTILASLYNEEGFWRLIGPNKLGFTNTKGLNQALFAACVKGHVRVAEQLVSFGAFIQGPTSFYSPVTGVLSEDSLPKLAIKCQNIQVLKTLVTLSRRLHDGDSHVDEVMRLTFQLPAAGILPLCDFLCSPDILPTVIRSEEWYARITKTQFWIHSSSIDAYCWIAVARNILRAQQAQKLEVAQKAPYLDLGARGAYADWTSISDDIMILLLRLGYVGISNQSRYETKIQAILGQECLLRRKSSRVVLATSVIPELYLASHNYDDYRWIDHRWDDLLSRVRSCVRYLSAPAVEALIYKLYPSGVYNHGTFEIFEQQSVVRIILKESMSQPFSKFLGKALKDKSGNVYNLKSYKDLFHLARCYRTCRQNGQRARRMYEDLKEISDNYDVSLKFPYGYMKANDRYVVKISILGSIYRWNYRIRRRKNLPFSAADTAYAKAVGLPIPKEMQTVVGSSKQS